MGNSSATPTSAANGGSAIEPHNGAPPPPASRFIHLIPETKYVRGTPRVFRVLFCGPKGCGKTSLLNAVVERTNTISRHDEARLEFHEIPSDSSAMNELVDRLAKPEEWIERDWVVYIADATDSNSHMSLAPLFNKLYLVFNHGSANIFANKWDLPEAERPLQLRQLVDLFTAAPGMARFPTNKSSAIMTLSNDGVSKLVADIEAVLEKDLTKWDRFGTSLAGTDAHIAQLENDLKGFSTMLEDLNEMVKEQDTTLADLQLMK